MWNHAKRAARFLAIAALAGAGALASAADLRIGLKADISSADPHVLDPANRNVWFHVYETLVAQDNTLKAVPRLARGWRAVDSTTWEFVLRPNVAFHDGTALTAEDVQASIERAHSMSGPRTYRTYLRDVESVKALEPLKVQIKTKQPSPNLPDAVSLIAIMPKAQARGPAEAVAKGEAAVGTGPYKFLEWARGERVAVARNDKYWGGQEPWDKVVFQFIPKEPARASALLSGAVDLIDGTNAGLSDAFEKSGRVTQVSATSYWMNYLGMDHYRANSPYVADLAGKPLAANPFQNLKVRQALNLAINREAIAKIVMKGDSIPTAQMVPADFFGHDTAIPVPAHDLARAKALLAEAGYPQGFKVTLHCSNDRYLNDARVCEAMGQMLTQAGLKVDVQTVPFSVFLTRLNSGGANKDLEFSLYMLGIGAVTGDSLTPLQAVLQTQDKQKGSAGANNYGQYANKALDELIDKAATTMNTTEREGLQKAAAKLVAQDLGIIPIHHLKTSWAVRKGLTLAPRADGFTFAMNVREGAAK